MNVPSVFQKAVNDLRTEFSTFKDLVGELRESMHPRAVLNMARGTLHAVPKGLPQYILPKPLGNRVRVEMGWQKGYFSCDCGR